MNNLFKYFFLVSLLVSLNLSFANSNEFLSGSEVYDFFKSYQTTNFNPAILKDEQITYFEFFDFFYNSYELDERTFRAMRAYKIVRDVNYRGLEGRYLYYAHSVDKIIDIQNKSFDLYAPVDYDTIRKATQKLDALGLEIEQISNQDIYDSLFYEVFSLINEKYYYSDDITKQKLFYGAIKGMVESLEDKHSNFQTPSELNSFYENLNQELEGIGISISINENGEFEIISPLKDSPAMEAGLIPGDIITHVNGISITGKPIEQGIGLIKGPENTRVNITVKRHDKILKFNLIRKQINIPLVEFKTIEDKNLLISIRSFGGNTYNSFIELIKATPLDEIENIILDLRSNSGGYLNEALNIAEEFLTINDKIAYQVSKDSYSEFTADNDGLLNKPIYILINRGTASAAEILALAIKGNSNAKIYGENSYGKGSVQEVITFKNDSALKLTTGLWLGPNKESIEGSGITPDILVEITPEDLRLKNDPVLNKVLLDIN